MKAAYSSAFLANVYFWLNTGYFDRPAETMPLLHIWSIGVEEQFYLIWPILLVLVWRFLRVGRSVVLVALACATILLVSLCIIWTAHDAKSAFYLPFTRLWEFTLGALVLALPEMRRPGLADVISALGMAAMLYATLTFTANLAYPGLYAMLPCVGTAAVLSAGGRGLIGRFLSLGPNAVLGKMSYSLYLWHWPMIVFYRFHADAQDQKIELILAAMAVAFVSWRFVELPIRRHKEHPRRAVAYGATVAASTGALAALVAIMAGFPGRLPEDFRSLSSDKEMTKLHCTQLVVLEGLLGKKRNCVIGAPWANSTRWAVLWGDSHARHLAPLLDIPARAQGLSLVYWPGCPPFVDNDKVRRNKQKSAEFSDRCADSRRQILDWIAKTPKIDLVIIANRWAAYPDNLYAEGIFDQSDGQKVLTRIEQGLDETLAEIDPHRHAILLIGDVPYPGFNVPDCALQTSGIGWRRSCPHDLNAFAEFDRPLQGILARAASGPKRIYYLDPVKAMCAPKGCPIRVNNEIIYADGHHLRQNLKPATFQELSSMLGLDEALRSATSDVPTFLHGGTPAH